MKVKQNSLGFWFIYLNDEVLAGGYLDKSDAIKEMESLK